MPLRLKAPRPKRQLYEIIQSTFQFVTVFCKTLNSLSYLNVSKGETRKREEVKYQTEDFAVLEAFQFKIKLRHHLETIYILPRRPKMTV
ncbi:hypothetical protein CDAR_212081 [Caerostris darwini]|uniref:Ribosomal protein S10 n=1 Tax=Caerostris darwini TaxID=1538125 RepID=A0AAV4NUE0_9ARAC|nr:hypothetical protein CDAR_212081 [Caerostris darwini]